MAGPAAVAAVGVTLGPDRGGLFLKLTSTRLTVIITKSVVTVAPVLSSSTSCHKAVFVFLGNQLMEVDQTKAHISVNFNHDVWMKHVPMDWPNGCQQR